MGMADFINHARAVRLKFTPDLTKMVASAGISPDMAVGLNHKRLANGVTIAPAKRTKTKIGRGFEDCSVRATNFIPKEMQEAMQRGMR